MSRGTFGAAVTLRGMISRLKKAPHRRHGGLKPGITTDTVATLVAESWYSDLISRPQIKTVSTQRTRAVTMTPDCSVTVSYPRLVEILGGKHSPGIHSIVDPVAVEIIAGNKLKLIVVKGDRPDNIIRAINGETVGSG